MTFLAAEEPQRSEVAELADTVPPVAPSSQLVVVAQPDGAPAEAFRALRTHIMAQHFQIGRRALAVCEASEGSGCTFVAANLAVALSRIGLKTMLIDANLRNPQLHQLFGMAVPQQGLAQCLATEDAPFSDFYRAGVQPSLSVMFAGARPEIPRSCWLAAASRRWRSFVCASSKRRYWTHHLPTPAPMRGGSVP